MEIPEIEPKAEQAEPTDAAAESQRLADATFEPEAAVEQTSDFHQAEAIETAFVQAVEQTAGLPEGVSPPFPAPEGGERLMVAPMEGGPERILAEGIIGPAPRVEELSREQEPHIPEGPAPSGSGEPVGITPINLPGPQETAMIGLTLDGKGGDLSSLDDKGNNLAEQLGSTRAETMGWKVEEGDKVVSLDGKGNDFMDQPEYPKVEIGPGTAPVESIFPKVELGSGLPSMETPDHKIDAGTPSPSIETPDHKIEMGAGSTPIETVFPKVDQGSGLPTMETPDHKFDTAIGSPPMETPDHKIDTGIASPSMEAPDHKIETGAGSASVESIFPKVEPTEGLEGKEPAYVKYEAGAFSWKVDRGLAETGFENLGPVLGRAVTDPQFRAQLVQEPDAALAEYDLSEAEQQLLKQIDPSRLETVVRDIQTRFGQVDDPAAQESLGRQLGQLLWGPQG